MSADLMLVCNDRNENYDNNSEKCICIDETLAGTPHTEFGIIFSGHFSGIFGGMTVDDKLIDRVPVWFESLEHKEYLDIEKIVTWLKDHEGESIDTECW